MIEPQVSLSQANDTCRLTHLTVKSAIQNLEKIHPNVIQDAADMKEALYSQISLSFRILLYHFRKCAMSQHAWARCIGSYRGTLKDLEPIVEILRKSRPSFDPEEEPEPSPRPVYATRLDAQALAPIPGFWQVRHTKMGTPKCKRCD